MTVHKKPDDRGGGGGYVKNSHRFRMGKSYILICLLIL